NSVTSVTGLGALGDNGGETPTFALTSTSVEALEQAADCTYASTPADNPFFNSVLGNTAPDRSVSTDQRGVTRPQNANCDIGAFELEFTDSPQEDEILTVN